MPSSVCGCVCGLRALGYFDELLVQFRLITHELAVFGEQFLPVAGDVVHFQVLADELLATLGDLADNSVILLGKLDQFLSVLEVLSHWNVVDPGLQGVVEELEPLVAHVKDQGLAEEQVLESEACCHSSEVEQVSWKRHQVVN